MRLAPCNPVPPSNHLSSRHTSSRPPALSSHNIFRSQRKSSPASDNNQGRGNYTHAPVLYPMTRRTPIAGWFPIRCRVSRSPRSPDGRRLALRQQSPHNSLARWHAPPQTWRHISRGNLLRFLQGSRPCDTPGWRKVPISRLTSSPPCWCCRSYTSPHRKCCSALWLWEGVQLGY